MRKVLFAVLLVSLTGCRLLTNSNVVIDWVDFIKCNGIEYNAIDSGIIADEKYIGEKLGEVKFKVADNVTDPGYRTKDGDAAFHEKGTEIFTINDFSNLIAVKDINQIHGYRVYYARDKMDYQWHYKSMPIEKVNRIEIYESYTENGTKQLTEIKDSEEIKRFLQIIVNSKEDKDFQPNTEKSDPKSFQMVFYTSEPIAYKYLVLFDGNTYYWYPWETAILSDQIGEFITTK